MHSLYYYIFIIPHLFMIISSCSFNTLKSTRKYRSHCNKSFLSSEKPSFVPSISKENNRNPIHFASWNINGIKSLLNHDIECNILNQFLYKNEIDILCLQETKIQDINLQNIENILFAKTNLKNIFWSCSRARKGYSGTAILLFDNNKTLWKNMTMNNQIWNHESDHCHNDDQEENLISIYNHIGETQGDLEGRTLTMIHKQYILVNVYTPNSGEGLKRLDYRIHTWDQAFSSYISKLRRLYPLKPIIITGDLNVAHKDIDYFNYNNPKAKLCAGTTPQEQKSLEMNLLMHQDLPFIDTFRFYHGDTIRKYSHFSNRKGELGRLNYEGWRLDYFLVNWPGKSMEIGHREDLLNNFVKPPFIEDSLCYPYSDHCPVGLSISFS